jgi:hypothetical protein
MFHMSLVKYLLDCTLFQTKAIEDNEQRTHDIGYTFSESLTAFQITKRN